MQKDISELYSCLVQNFDVKMSLICMKMNVQVKHGFARNLVWSCFDTEAEDNLQIV